MMSSILSRMVCHTRSGRGEEGGGGGKGIEIDLDDSQDPRHTCGSYDTCDSLIAAIHSGQVWGARLDIEFLSRLSSLRISVYCRDPSEYKASR